VHRREYVAAAAAGCSPLVAGCQAGGPDYHLEAFRLPVTLTAGDAVTPSVRVVSDDTSPISTEVVVEIGDRSGRERTELGSGETRRVAIQVDVDLEPGRYEATADAAGADNQLSRQVEVVDAAAAETRQRTPESPGHTA